MWSFQFQLRVIGHCKVLSEDCSRIELLEARDYLLVHGMEKRCRIGGVRISLWRNKIHQVSRRLNIEG